MSHLSLFGPRIGGWNNVIGGTGNDWTVLDPAIVSGQMANPRPESPSNWIKTSYEQLASEAGSFNQKGLASMLPTFSNMSLSSPAGSNRGMPGTNQWGGPLMGGQGASGMAGNGGFSAGSASGGAPPPGFNMGALGPIPNSFQNISSLNTTNDGHQIESKFSLKVQTNNHNLLSLLFQFEVEVVDIF